jgi:hypothetical protein
MTRATHIRPSLEADGWMLVSAEEREAAHPETFQIPTKIDRQTLVPGVAAKLLFHIETKEGDRVIDRGVDRMWVIVAAVTPEGYMGVLDNDPGLSDGLNLRAGDVILFGPEHVAAIEYPSRDYVVKKYGWSFFGNESG